LNKQVTQAEGSRNEGPPVVLHCTSLLMVNDWLFDPSGQPSVFIRACCRPRPRPQYDITVEKALSGPHTLRVGLAWWAFGMCMAFTNFVIVSRMFRGKVSLESGGYGH
jgi:hypothetical protein